jgi:hypothetical protein
VEEEWRKSYLATSGKIVAGTVIMKIIEIKNEWRRPLCEVTTVVKKLLSPNPQIGAPVISLSEFYF